MSSYQQRQGELFRKTKNDFKKGKISSSIVGSVRDYIHDERICLTSVVFLPKEIQKLILDKIIQPLKKIDQRQYFYLPKSFHLTLQNVRTINDPPLFTKKDIIKVRKVFKEVIPKHQAFSFKLKDLFELPTSLSLCGYCGEVLKYLVLELRNKLQKASVPDNKKYVSEEVFFGNITVCRYTKNLTKRFLARIQELKNIEIGRFKVEKVSLITTNSVCYPDKTTIIENYNFRD